MFIDSHCHLLFKKFQEHCKDDICVDYYSLDSVINRAKNAGVKYMLNICTDLSDIDALQKINNLYSCVFGTIGVHPSEVMQHFAIYNLDEMSAIIENACCDEKIIAIGEIGLDKYHETETLSQQMDLFHLQMNIAQKLKLPVCIHSREAEEETLSVISQYNDVNGVMHCFTGSKKFAYKVLDLGYSISFSGVITFKKSIDLQDIVKCLPKDKILVETDAPFLAPEPFRGHVNEPAYVVYTAMKVAQLLSISIEDFSQQVLENFWGLFKKVRL